MRRTGSRQPSAIDALSAPPPLRQPLAANGANGAAAGRCKAALARGPSLLCADEATRRRLLEMERELRPIRTALFVMLLAAILGMGPFVGFWPLGPLAGAAVGFLLADLASVRSARPEYPLMAAWCFSQSMIAVSAYFTGADHSLFMFWLAIPAATLTSRFNSRGVAVGVAFTIGLMAAVALARDPSALGHEPQYLIAPATVLCGVTLLSTALMHSDVKHRSKAVIDPLTGLFNRQALFQRGSELLERMDHSSPVSLLLGDLDRFKAVNDRLGHLVGDRVLRDTAAVLRSSLRAFDHIYRYGGEELVVVLPADIEEAAATAERLRWAVAAAPRPGGVGLTISFGVAAARPGEELSELIARADRALYAAKAAGRDRVRLADS